MTHIIVRRTKANIEQAKVCPFYHEHIIGRIVIYLNAQQSGIRDTPYERRKIKAALGF